MQNRMGSVQGFSKKMDAALTAGPAHPSVSRVLVVDDSRAQRQLLSVYLRRWGYQVLESSSAEEALALCSAVSVDVVISDWMMSGMTGVEFCKRFRALPNDRYSYFILLTSKSEKAEIASGLEAGADDFVPKPISSGELHARLRAGERILSMQAELVEKNRVVEQTLAELQHIYDSIDRDLIEAGKLQQAFVRDRQREFGKSSASILMRPSGHVGGDLAGCFSVNARRIVLYSVDVAGHGIASAMMTARLAGLLSGLPIDESYSLIGNTPGQRDSWPPEMVAQRFNRLLVNDLKVDQYFTLAYAEVDLPTGRVQLVQAGHPHPMILRASGAIDLIGLGGMPIGLIPGAAFERVTAQLYPGDRLFLMSDGITECPDPKGQELGAEGLAALLDRNAGLSSTDLLQALVWDLASFAGTEDFPDDVSGLIFDYRG